MSWESNRPQVTINGREKYTPQEAFWLAFAAGCGAATAYNLTVIGYFTGLQIVRMVWGA